MELHSEVMRVPMSDEHLHLPILKFGRCVDYTGANDFWRFEVAVPEDLASVSVTGSVLRTVLEVRGGDEKVLRILIAKNWEIVERYVAIAELGKWPDAMGVFPEWRDGKEPN